MKQELYYTANPMSPLHTPATPNDRPNDEYDMLLGYIRESFERSIASGEKLFATSASNLDLFDVFLKHLPEEARQHYTCNECRRFVNRYGHLVTIDKYGEVMPVMWRQSPEFFFEAVREVFNVVKKSKVTGVFLTSDKRLGVAKTGIWHHMAVDIPSNMRYRKVVYTADQVMADKLEDFKMLVNALNKYKIDTVKTAVNILESESLYRGEKVLGIAKWFLKVHEDTDGVKGATTTRPVFTNLVWKYVADAPAGFCHISSSMIGTLLDDIEDGLSFDVVKRKFDEKMNPTKYQRPQVAPTRGNVERAEKLVKDLGLERSLKRRFARLDEIETIWKPNVMPIRSGRYPWGSNEFVAPAVSAGIFSNIKTKEKEAENKYDIFPRTQTMTWEKFKRTVLPDARKIFLHVGDGRQNFAAMVTANDFDAPPIIQWDTEEHRNPFSWYLYNGGSYAEYWNLKTLNAGYAEVTGISLQPNMWQPGYEHQGEGVMFILKDCKDTRNRSSGLFPEILRGELREVRHTIEAYSQANDLAGYHDASACGILIQKGFHQSRGVTLRVTTDVGVRTYFLDRWD